MHIAPPCCWAHLQSRNWGPDSQMSRCRYTDLVYVYVYIAPPCYSPRLRSPNWDPALQMSRCIQINRYVQCIFIYIAPVICSARHVYGCPTGAGPCILHR